MGITLSEERLADAAAAVVSCLHSGSGSAARRAANFLAPDVVLAVVAPSATEEIRGREAVVDRLSGEWPNAMIYRQLGFSTPYQVGYLPRESTVEFTFGADGLISRIERVAFSRPPAIVTDTIPLFLRGVINGALSNGTPLTFGYIDLEGRPSLSLRGSTQVYDATTLSVWLRTSSGGVSKAIGAHPSVAFHYRDDNTRTTLSIQGDAHIETDELIRDRVYWAIPEVEQRHDPEQGGTALLVDVRRISGTSLEGPITLER
jgi:hypothetical protein